MTNTLFLESTIHSSKRCGPENLDNILFAELCNSLIMRTNFRTPREEIFKIITGSQGQDSIISCVQGIFAEKIMKLVFFDE